MASYDSNFSVFIRNRGAVDPAKWSASPTEIVRLQANPPKRYSFDHVFDHACTQQDVFEHCAEPLVEEFLHGYNTTVFAYGQTGTGKTYTMTGDCSEQPSAGADMPSLAAPHTSGLLDASFDLTTPAALSRNAGLVPRVLAAIFGRLARQDTADWILEMSFVELYNEELRDLFYPSEPPRGGPKAGSGPTIANSGNSGGVIGLRSTAGSATGGRARKFLKIVENKSTKSVDVQGATHLVVNSLDHALGYVRKALQNRETAATSLNADSSRSHTILTLVLVNKQHAHSKLAVRSKLNLVDLAGSENVAKSGALNKRAKEAGDINRSLLALGRVIEKLVAAEDHHNASSRHRSSGLGSHNGSANTSSTGGTALRHSRPYVPYRDSRLTHLLQDSLGGSTKTVMIATVDLGSLHSEDSRNTLEYASKAKSIRNQLQTEMALMDLPTVLAGYQQKFIEYQNAFAIQQNREGVHISKAHFDALKRDRKNAERLEAQLQGQLSEIDDLKRGVADRTRALDEKAQLATDQQAVIGAQARAIKQLEARIAAMEHDNRSSRAQHLATEQLNRVIETLEGQTTTYVTKVEHFYTGVAKRIGDIPADLAQATKTILDTTMVDWFSDEYRPQLLDGCGHSLTTQFAMLSEELSHHLHQAWSQSIDKLMAGLDSGLLLPAREQLKELRTITENTLQSLARALNDVSERADRDREVEDIGFSLRRQNEEVRTVLDQLVTLQSQRERLVADLVEKQTASADMLPQITGNLQRASTSIESVNGVTAKLDTGLAEGGRTLDLPALDVVPVEEKLRERLGTIKTDVTTTINDITSGYQTDKLDGRQRSVEATVEKLKSMGELVSKTGEESQRPKASARHFQKELLLHLSSLREMDFGDEPKSDASQRSDPRHSSQASAVNTSLGSSIGSRPLSQPTQLLGSPTRSPRSPVRSPQRSPTRLTGSPVRSTVTSPLRQAGHSPRKALGSHAYQNHPGMRLRHGIAAGTGDHVDSGNLFSGTGFRRLANLPSSHPSSLPSLPPSVKGGVGMSEQAIPSTQAPLTAIISPLPQPSSHPTGGGRAQKTMPETLGSPSRPRKIRAEPADFRRFVPNKRPRTNQGRP